MRILRPLAVAIAVLLPASAFAQLDDDLLAPLTDEPEKKKKRKPKKKAPKKEKKVEKVAPPEDDLLLESLVSNKTELLVKLPPGFKGAQLFVDGKDMGPITGGAVEVTPGEHTVTLKRIGYAELTKKVTVAPNKVTEVPASMEPVAGVLTATVEPSDAEIYVDGQRVGAGQVKDYALIPGNRVITFRKSGMKEERREVSVKPGKDYPLAVTLSPLPATTTIVAQNADRPENTNITNPEVRTNEPVIPLETEREVEEGPTPMYKRWYVWAGVGAVVAGAAAGAIAVSQNSNSAANGKQPADVCRGEECDYVMNFPGLGFGRF